MKTAAIIQARLGSTRLPRKVLLPLQGRPMLAHVVERVARAHRVDEVVVATTTCSMDDELWQFCRANGWRVVRGSETDVLSRYWTAAQEVAADQVVRITADCPLIDSAVIDQVIWTRIIHPIVDYASNTIEPRSFPRGLDVEVMSAEALNRAWSEDKKLEWREHVTPYLYRNPDSFSLRSVQHPADLSALRWTVDTPEDYQYVTRIFDAFPDNKFTWSDVLALTLRHPEWANLNAHVPQKIVPK
jgi:spore coat polysaccharide biosynthesis protein SpsF